VPQYIITCIYFLKITSVWRRFITFGSRWLYVLDFSGIVCRPYLLFQVLYALSAIDRVSATHSNDHARLWDDSCSLFDGGVKTIRALGARRSAEWMPRVVLFHCSILAVDRWLNVQSKLTRPADLLVTYMTRSKSYTQAYNIFYTYRIPISHKAALHQNSAQIVRLLHQGRCTDRLSTLAKHSLTVSHRSYIRHLLIYLLVRSVPVRTDACWVTRGISGFSSCAFIFISLLQCCHRTFWHPRPFLAYRCFGTARTERLH